MNRLARILAVICIVGMQLCAMIISGGSAYADDVVVFPDPVLDSIMHGVTGVPEGNDIYASNLSPITSLDVNGMGITDITGLEYCINMQSLNLRDNPITNISPLSTMTNMWSLAMTNMSITDISPVAGMTVIDSLYFEDNNVSDISALGNLTILQWVFFGNNHVVDISPLANCTILNFCLVEGNEIVDVSPLSGLASLSDLRLTNNNIVNISPLTACTALDILFLEGNNISTIPDLSGLSVLDHLTLSYNEISDISGLSLPASLESLTLAGNSITDISALSALTSLARIDLSSNLIVDISALEWTTSLTSLDLSNNLITNIKPLDDNVGISGEIYLNANPLDDVSVNTYIPSLEGKGITVIYFGIAPVIPPPPSGERTVFYMDEVTEESPAFYGLAVWSMLEDSGCEAWNASWSSGMLYPAMPSYYSWIYNSAEGMISRLMYSYNTSGLPDDAVITDAFIRTIPFAWYSDGLDDYDVIVGGTYNSSVFPFIIDIFGEGEMPVIYYSESEFYGEFGGFATTEIPLAPETMNYNQSKYIDITLNNDGLDYINPEGLTTLTFRAEDDVNYICPVPEGNFFVTLWTMDMVGAGYPQTVLVVDWYSPSGEGEPIIPTGPVSVMMTIQALIFTFGGLLGIMALVLKPEIASFGIRAGLLLGLTIITVVGVAMLESIVVAITR